MFPDTSDRGPRPAADIRLAVLARGRASRVRRRVAALLAAAAWACAPAPEPAPPGARTPLIEASFDIAPGSTFDTAGGARFGGLSGLAFDAASGDLLAISDDSEASRIFRLRLREDPFTVAVVGVIPLQGTPVAIDPEAIALLPGGHLLIASEGRQNLEPRAPPGLFEYTRDGVFVRMLEVREKFVPPASGPIDHGVRENASFESLASSAGGAQLFTATETALAQDGDPSGFGRGARTRVLEYVRRGDTWVPGREWAYDLDPMDRPAFKAGFFVNGLVELAAIDASHLLALERSFVENVEDAARPVHRIRLYRVSLQGATDVSGLDSIRSRGDLTPLAKSLVLDLGAAAGVPAALAAAGLANFEGMAFGPPRPGGLPAFYLVSDDDFSPARRTWLLRLRL